MTSLLFSFPKVGSSWSNDLERLWQMARESASELGARAVIGVRVESVAEETGLTSHHLYGTAVAF